MGLGKRIYGRKPCGREVCIENIGKRQNDKEKGKSEEFMIRINQIRMPVNGTEETLRKKIEKKLRLGKEEQFTYEIIRRSIDARKKPELFYCYTVDVRLPSAEEHILKRRKDSQILFQPQVEYRFPYSCHEEGAREDRPVIVGMGPAGLFCGYMLAVHGFRPIILERGEEMEKREAAVEKFWQTGILNPESNVQFGEGGAGTFSDGKLNTLVKDKEGRGRAILSILTAAGAPERILYDYMPHIGTDILKKTVVRMRETIRKYGGDIRFGQKVTGFLIKEGRMEGVVLNQAERLPASRVVLAIGHSARDTFQILHEEKIPMEAKAFAVGLRVEHPQRMINRSQYGKAEHEIGEAAPYKVVGKISCPAIYSFCMCPGGFVVNASSEQGRTAVNGMSYSKRNGHNANSAIVMAVTPKDYGGSGPLAGIDFQRQLEEKAFAAGKGRVPVESYGDFKHGVENGHTEADRPKAAESGYEDMENFSPSIKGEWCLGPVHEILPEALNRTFIAGMTEFGKQIQGFDDDRVWVSGVESRTSSPVRILRDDSLQSAVRGLFPCGEGAGYAGGIMSAAMDGMKIAEAVAFGIQTENQRERKQSGYE